MIYIFKVSLLSTNYGYKTKENIQPDYLLMLYVLTVFLLLNYYNKKSTENNLPNYVPRLGENDGSKTFP